MSILVYVYVCLSLIGNASALIRLFGSNAGVTPVVEKSRNTTAGRKASTCFAGKNQQWARDARLKYGARLQTSRISEYLARPMSFTLLSGRRGGPLKGIKPSWFVNNRAERKVIRLFEHVLSTADPKSDVVIDTGMNAGFYTILSATWGFRVHGIELQRLCHELCATSLQAQALGNLVTLHHNAASNLKGAKSLRVSSDRCKAGTFDIAASKGGGFDYVRPLSLSRLVAQCGYDTVALVKVDVDGAEITVLESILDVVKKVRNLVFEINTAEEWKVTGVSRDQAARLLSKLINTDKGFRYCYHDREWHKVFEPSYEPLKDGCPKPAETWRELLRENGADNVWLRHEPLPCAKLRIVANNTV